MTSITAFDFNGTGVRVTLVDGEPWFAASDVCRVLEIRNSRDAMTRLDDDEKGVAIADTPGGEQRVTIISESGLFALVMTSRKAEAKTFRRWVTGEVLPAIRRTGQYQAQPAPQRDTGRLAGELALLQCAVAVLRVPESGRLTMLRKVGEAHQLDTGFLPTYGVDDAPDAPGSSLATLSLTALLKQHGVRTSAAAFNRRLHAAGILTRLERTRSGGGKSEFWSVTAAGLRYGKNVVSPECPRETQPHWFVERFSDLVELASAREDS